VSGRPVALITGASGGIGADLARVFAAHGHEVAIVARSKAKLVALADELEAAGLRRPLVIAADLSRPEAPQALVESCQAAGVTVEILVNNAGFGLAGESFALDPEAQLNMIDLNVRALVELNLRFAPQIVAARGRILNVASVAAFLPGPGMAVYYATKAFVLSYSQALSQELVARDVVVTTLCPGPVATGFQQTAGFDETMLLNRFGTVSSRRVAERAYAGLMAGKRIVFPTLMDRLSALAGQLPKALLLPVVARVQKKRNGGLA
jgi:short-subunit dehydrogenase